MRSNFLKTTILSFNKHTDKQKVKRCDKEFIPLPENRLILEITMRRRQNLCLKKAEYKTYTNPLYFRINHSAANKTAKIANKYLQSIKGMVFCSDF